MVDVTRLQQAGHEALYRACDPGRGLTAYIAIHSTRLGPAAGGLRMRAYADEAAAIADVLRLAQGMTFKNAAAGLPLGGGKAVIIGDPGRDKTPDLLRAFGEAIQSLDGRYWTAEDMGMTPDDMAVIGSTSDFVAGLAQGAHASGDPSPVTARGVLNAIAIALRHRTGDGGLAGRRVAVQGLGHVGLNVCRLLRDAGAEVVVSDVDPGRLAAAADGLGATPAPADRIGAVPADVFAPCAIGGILTPAAIATLQTVVVAGAANNQLSSDAEADLLHARGVLYAPDFIVNGGGIINVAAEICRIADRAAWVESKLAELAETLDAVLAAAARQDVSPQRVAMQVVAAKLAA